MSSRITRRNLVRGGAAASVGAFALLADPYRLARAQTTTPPLVRGAAFMQGIASGQPSSSAITLWTRLTGLTRTGSLTVEVYSDSGASNTVKRTTAIAAPENDGTARVRITGLSAHKQYYYRFISGDGSSALGRFRTTPPAGSKTPVTIAYFSCQEYIAGFYHAHNDLAKMSDVDLVLCLGDYIYEQGFAQQGSSNQPARQDMTGELNNGDVQKLGEYREKYNLYNADRDLIEMRRRHTMQAVWDDHTVEDNYAANRPGGATSPAERRQTFTQRRQNAYRAFFEHMPRIRNSSDPDRIYGKINLGNAEVFLLDTRQYRDDQPCNTTDRAFSDPCPPAVVDDPNRTLLGSAQKKWLKDSLAASTATWKILANQVMIMSLDAPARNSLNTDAWDGYGAERRELIRFIGGDPKSPRNRIENVSFLTGDIHTFFAGDVTESGRQKLRGPAGDLDNTPPDSFPRATEFVGGSVTSPGIVDRLARDEAERNAAAIPGDANVLGNNPHIAFSNQAYKGYAILKAGTDLTVRYRAVREHTRPDDKRVFELRRFRVANGRPVVIDETGPLPTDPQPEPGPLPVFPTAPF